MIKYHGTPVGGSKYDCIKFLNGRHALISFAHPTQSAEVLEFCESFCIDNGAFTIWKTTGGDIDVLKYKSFVNTLAKHPAYDFCIIPDKIMGSEKENDIMIAQWEDLGVTHNAIPVFHLGESPDRFLKLASKYHKVCLGSTDLWPKNGSRGWWKNMANFMDYVTDSDGVLPCKVHGLRMLDPKLFQYLPLHSGDSTNAGVNGHIAMKKPPFPAVHRWQGNERIAQRIEAWQSAPVWNRELLIRDGILEK